MRAIAVREIHNPSRSWMMLSRVMFWSGPVRAQDRGARSRP
jgi:hypothetical protein